MSNTLLEKQIIKCKHCEKTFPTQQALQNHMKHVNAGKAGGYRKQRRQRYTLPEQDVTLNTRTNGTPTALDRLAEIRARKEQLIEAMALIQEDEKVAMEAVQREYDETSKKMAAYSTELTVARRVAIGVREELEAHKQTPEQS